MCDNRNVLLVWPRCAKGFYDMRNLASVVVGDNSKAQFSPLSLLTVAACLGDRWNYRLVDEDVRPVEESDFDWAAYVLVSINMLQYDSAMALIDRARAAGKKVVAGGPYFHAMQHEDLPQGITVVSGEMESPEETSGLSVAATLCRDMEQGSLKSCYRAAGRPDITKSPVPRYDLIDCSRYFNISMQTSRGCFHACTFCQIPPLYGPHRRKTAAQVVAELDRLLCCGKAGRTVYIVDDNFMGAVDNPREREKLVDLLSAVRDWQQERGVPFDFFVQCSLEIADRPDLVAMMAGCGVNMMFLGIETLNADILEKAKKTQNLDGATRNLLQTQADKVSVLRRAGIGVFAGMMLGFDEDENTGVDNLIAFLDASLIPVAGITILQAPPGTALYRQMLSAQRIVADRNALTKPFRTNIAFSMDPVTFYNEYRRCIDTIYAPARLKHLPDMAMRELSCAAQGDAAECRYRISWKPLPSPVERAIDFLQFRLRSQRSIIRHMEENHERLQKQYNEIKSLQDFYHHIMASLSEAVVWVDTAGRIAFANAGFAAMVRSGPAADVITGALFTGFLTGDGGSRPYERLLQARRQAPGVPETVELLMQAVDGVQRIGLATCLYVQSPAHDPGYLFSIRDITERRTMEQKLSAVENRYRMLYEHSPAIIVGLDRSGNILYANPAMADQSGYTEDELKAMHFSRLLGLQEPPDQAAGLLAQRLGQVGLQEVHYRTKHGEWKSLTITTFPLTDERNSVIGLGCIGVDITETKRLNELLVQTQRMDLLGKMAGGLAHDFKNVLTVVNGYSRLIADSTKEAKSATYAQAILSAGERAAGLTQNLLTFSRGESVKNELFAVNDVIKEVMGLLPPLLKGRVEALSDLPAETVRMRGDSGKIHQCLLNLCINARDALNGKPDARIILRLRGSNHSPGMFTVEVCDNGPGIPPAIINRIFDPFFSTKPKGEGIGLGLSVVYGIVKAHGGEIAVDSRPGEGATFIMRFPQGDRDADTAPSAARQPSAPVLVIDNDDVSRGYTENILSNNGYVARGYANCREAAAWTGTQNGGRAVALFAVPPDPETVGWRLERETLKAVWIGESRVSPVEKDEVLLKPFPPAALVETVRRLQDCG